MFLLDTDVVSELRKPKPHGAVLAWIEGVEESALHLSAVTLGELQAGVEALRARDAQRAFAIEGWLDLIAGSYNILAMDARCFRRWARLMRGRPDSAYEDAMIAATALEHGLTVATRNLRDFRDFGVPLVDPFAAARS